MYLENVIFAEPWMHIGQLYQMFSLVQPIVFKYNSRRLKSNKTTYKMKRQF